MPPYIQWATICACGIRQSRYINSQGGCIGETTHQTYRGVYGCVCVACLCKYAYVSEGVCLHLLLGACTNLLGIQTALPSHHTTCISSCGMCGPLPSALCPRSHGPLCTPLPPTVYTATSWYLLPLQHQLCR